MTNRSPGSSGRQRGIAIVTAMLVVALGTITMVSIVSRQQLVIQRERNEATIGLARDLAVSGERFAAAILYRDRQDALRENTDSLDDDWAQTLPPVPIDEGAALQGCIVDMQGRFNLNNLADADGAPVPAALEQLQRLLVELAIDPVKAQAVLDWVDADIDATLPDGAEDDYYSGLTPAYRAANAPMRSASELKLVKGFSPSVEEEAEDYERLLPHVATLPVDGGPTAVNVNTATPEVIASIAPDLKGLEGDLTRWDTGAYEDYPECEDLFDLSADEGPDALVADQERLPFESKLIFGDAADPNGANDLDLGPETGYDVASSYFQLRIDVLTEAVRVSQYTLFQRDDQGRTRVLYRSRDTI